MKLGYCISVDADGNIIEEYRVIIADEKVTTVCKDGKYIKAEDVK